MLKKIDKDGEIFYEWECMVRVHASWVADGFNLTAERLHAMVNGDLGGAYTWEIEAEIVDAPATAEILSEQGYGKIDARYAAERDSIDKEPNCYP